MYKSLHIDILTPTKLVLTLIFFKSIIHVHKKRNLLIHSIIVSMQYLTLEIILRSKHDSGTTFEP